ncbi:MAG: 2-oxoacid:acceptor oxidoreductase family protein [Clostridiaceae bacterium]|nr:2-oxoacid:acceptor oxidoreductase family protein [Clostridiaceae bacterium]
MKEIRFYGVGGQGVVVAAKTFSVAVSIYENGYATTIPAYGHERRGAPVYADIVADNKPILKNCFLYELDGMMIMDDTLISKHISIEKFKNEDTFLVLNTNSCSIAEEYKNTYHFRNVYYVNATAGAIKHIGKPIPNSAMLGALAATGIVKIESIEQAIRETFGAKAGDCNAKAAREAYAQTTKI